MKPVRKRSNIIPNLIEDLKKSGFLSEIDAIQISKKAGWDVNPNESFDDPQEDKSRAIDFVAWKERSFPKRENFARNGVQIFLACEVKKSERPWIIFAEKERTYHWPLANGSALPGSVSGYFSNTDPIENAKKFVGYGIHESFKPPSESSRWFSAAITAFKAAEYLQQHETAEDFPTETAEYPEWFYFKLRYFFPVIIIDGDLFRAQGSQKGVRLFPLDMIAVRLSHKSDKKDSKDFLVHVVSKQYLQKYFAIIEKFQGSMFERIFEQGGQLNKNKVMNDFIKKIDSDL